MKKDCPRCGSEADLSATNIFRPFVQRNVN